MTFARIGHGSCYHHSNEIFAGVFREVSSRGRVNLFSKEKGLVNLIRLNLIHGNRVLNAVKPWHSADLVSAVT